MTLSTELPGKTVNISDTFGLTETAAVQSGMKEPFFQHPEGPLIYMLDTPEDARLAIADDILDVLAEANDGDAILLSTGNTSIAFYRVFIARAKQRNIDLTRFHY